MSAVRAPARNAAHPAGFDRATQRKRAMFAKINIARQQLAIAEDDYRQILLEETGEISLKTLGEAQLEKVLARMTRLGFRALPKAGAKSPAAQHPMARKARALWISLYHLGVVHNPSEQALEAFAKRQLGCDKLVWARQSDGFKLIEALKVMAMRGGWMQHDPETGKPLSVIRLQANLCEAIMVRLRRTGLAPQHWQLHHAAWSLCGIENAKETPWSAEDYSRCAGALGAKLRECGIAGEQT